MKRIFCLAAVLAVCVILANGDNECQYMANIVGNMSSVELGPYNCTPAVWNDGSNQFINFTTTTDDPPCDVNRIIVKYLAPAMGNATSSYSSVGNQVTISYIGDYVESLRKLPAIQLLVKVLGLFKDPILGKVNCTTHNSFTTPSGFSYIALYFLASPDDYQSLADDIYTYLCSTKLLDGNATNTVYQEPGTDYALLEIWGTDCETSVQVTQ